MCSESKTALRNDSGTRGRATPVETSHKMVASDLAKGMDSILSEEEEVQSRVISTSPSCAAAMAPKSMTGW